MAKKFDAKAKAKRQKIMAAGGAVLLLGLLAFQVPRVMKMLNAKPPPIETTAAAPSTVPGDPSVLPTPGTVDGGAAPTASGGGTLVDSDATPTPATGQLVAFGRFASKDPFQQQIDIRAIPSSPTPTGAGGAKGEEGDEGSVVPGQEGSGVKPAPDPEASGTSAVISVNGAEETVAVGGEFPKDSPVFKLVKIVGGEAKVAIAGGSFASGSPTVSLVKGKPLTLVNTADGTRYELKLLSIG